MRSPRSSGSVEGAVSDHGPYSDLAMRWLIQVLSTGGGVTHCRMPLMTPAFRRCAAPLASRTAPVAYRRTMRRPCAAPSTARASRSTRGRSCTATAPTRSGCCRECASSASQWCRRWYRSMRQLPCSYSLTLQIRRRCRIVALWADLRFRRRDINLYFGDSAAPDASQPNPLYRSAPSGTRLAVLRASLVSPAAPQLVAQPLEP
jgi:hypothetical protein